MGAVARAVRVACGAQQRGPSRVRVILTRLRFERHVARQHPLAPLNGGLQHACSSGRVGGRARCMRRAGRGCGSGWCAVTSVARGIANHAGRRGRRGAASAGSPGMQGLGCTAGGGGSGQPLRHRVSCGGGDGGGRRSPWAGLSPAGARTTVHGPRYHRQRIQSHAVACAGGAVAFTGGVGRVLAGGSGCGGEGGSGILLRVSAAVHAGGG